MPLHKYNIPAPCKMEKSSMSQLHRTQLLSLQNKLNNNIIQFNLVALAQPSLISNCSRAMAQATYVVFSTLVALLNLSILEVSGLYLCPPATTTLYAMEPCMPSVEGTHPDPPNEDCCYIIRTTEPGCLCTAFSGYKNSPSINERAALTLPKLCGRAVPFNFTCNGIPVPSAELPQTRKLRL